MDIRCFLSVMFILVPDLICNSRANKTESPTVSWWSLCVSLRLYSCRALDGERTLDIGRGVHIVFD
ncbi:hypothetical protein BHE74_00051140 [Ensete ventricosum]|nr:hypothetical protein GW17_00039481 [Ensete ventricosum]RWW43224.1 hypothetical protein BHE74_00051140 [Ensete ventricosum]RZS24617.1 hypothetical protein BHM03_00057734 [Ensete ventricosum]